MSLAEQIHTDSSALIEKKGIEDPSDSNPVKNVAEQGGKDDGEKEIRDTKEELERNHKKEERKEKNEEEERKDKKQEEGEKKEEKGRKDSKEEEKKDKKEEERKDKKEEEEDRKDKGEEEEGECGFCLFMKGGECKEAFIGWENCVRDAEKAKEDLVEKCYMATDLLKRCMLEHSNYYGPVLGMDKDLEEESGKVSTQENASTSSSTDLVLKNQSDDQKSGSNSEI